MTATDPLTAAIEAAIWAGYSDTAPSATGLVLANPRIIASVAANTARAVILREAAEESDQAAGAYAEQGADDPSSGANTAASALFALMETFLRKANEAEYVATPCDSMNPCEDGGEPCHVHERLMAHAEGEHELCGPECTAQTT